MIERHTERLKRSTTTNEYCLQQVKKKSNKIGKRLVFSKIALGKVCPVVASFVAVYEPEITKEEHRSRAWPP